MSFRFKVEIGLTDLFHHEGTREVTEEELAAEGYDPPYTPEMAEDYLRSSVAEDAYDDLYTFVTRIENG